MFSDIYAKVERNLGDGFVGKMCTIVTKQALGIPHLGIIPLSRACATAEASAFEVGKVTIHLDHMSTINRQYFLPSEGESSMKSIIMFKYYVQMA